MVDIMSLFSLTMNNMMHILNRFIAAGENVNNFTLIAISIVVVN